MTIPVLWPEPCRGWVRRNWREEAVNLKDLERFWMKEWSLISCQVFSDLNPVEDEWGELKRRSCESEDLEWFWMKEWSLISCQVFSDLNPVEDEWGELKRRSCESEDLEWFWMKEWSLISCQVFSDLNPVEDEWGELKRRSCESEGSGEILDEGMVSDLVSGVLWSEPCRRWVSELKRRSCESEDLERFWMKEWSLISCQVFSDLNPVENEWDELKRRSCESEGSGEMLYEENSLWSLIRCSPNSSGIIGDNSELLPWEKDIAIIGCQYLWPTWTRESIYFTMRFPPTFNCFTSMIGWKCLNER